MSEHSVTDQDHTPDVHNPRYHHGRSPAAWAGVVVAIVGFIVMAVAVLIPSLVLFIVSTAVIVVAVILTRALQVLGYGNNHHLKA